MKFSDVIVRSACWVRAFLGLAFVPLWTVLWSFFVIGLSGLGFVHSTTTVMWIWSHGLLKFFGIRLQTKGFELIPASGGAVLAFNHQSHFDIPAVTGSSFRTIRYGAKIELFKIPVFGIALRAAGSLPITRSNRTEVLKVYRDAAVRLKQGYCFALAPEGTRQDGPQIGSFKRGPFIFAGSSGVPVVPVVIEGADRVLPKGQIMVNLGRWNRTIQVEVLPPLFASQRPVEIGDDLPAEVIADFAERTRSEVVTAFARMRIEGLEMEQKS